MILLRHPLEESDSEFTEASTTAALDFQHFTFSSLNTNYSDCDNCTERHYMSQTPSFGSHQSSRTKQQSQVLTSQQYNEAPLAVASSGLWSNQSVWHQHQAYDFATQQPEDYHRWWQMPPYQRALSHASAHSYESSSPYSPQTSIPYALNTSTTHNSHLAPNQASSQPVSPAQNLPTPTHTPVQDFVGRSNPRRTSSSIKPDGLNAAQQAFRGNYTTQPPFLHRSTSRHGGGSGSSYSQDFPVTPKTANGDEFEAGGPASGEKFSVDYNWLEDQIFVDEPAAVRHVPNFDRTMSDIYQDELYDPSNRPQVPSNTSSLAYNHHFLSPNQTMVTQRLQQANQARNGAPQPYRQVSPFRQDSEWSKLSNDMSVSQHYMQTAAGLRERQKAERDAYVYRQHHPQPEETEPNTISPKDAFPMESNVGDEEMHSLFPASSQHSGNGDSTGLGRVGASSSAQFNFSAPTNTFSFATPSLPASASNVEQRSIPQYRPESSHSELQESMTFPAALPSMETTKSDVEEEPEDESSSSLEELSKPSGTTASAGTYTCTYHGCSRRFNSPPQLQKHKREDHRTTGAIAHDTDNSASAAMTQAGPHRCTRKNPATGRPCNTVFSRPYDLTRHEDTIHAERKKVRCPHCTEEKLFSRADALTRHLRVVHPHMSFSTKHRKRAID